MNIYKIRLSFLKQDIQLIPDLISFITANESVTTLDKSEFIIKINLYGYYHLIIIVKTKKSYKNMLNKVKLWLEEQKNRTKIAYYKEA